MWPTVKSTVWASRVHTTVNCEEQLDSPERVFEYSPEDPLNFSLPCAVKVISSGKFTVPPSGVHRA